jgi:hypothetical protein
MPTIYLIRHEDRYKDGFYDCSLTPNGIKNSITKIDDKILEYEKDFPIYCSPMLRTIQTIYHHANLHEKQINLEELIYEHINNNIAHYSLKKKLPTIETKNLFLFSDLLKYFENNIIKKENLLQKLRIFLIFLNAYTNIDDITLITNLTLDLIIKLEKEIFNDTEIDEYILQVSQILNSYNMNKIINENYNTYKIKIQVENYTETIERTKILLPKLLQDSAIYVTHLTIVNSILINIYKAIYKEYYLEKLSIEFKNNFNNEIDFCHTNLIKMGCVIRLEINKENINIFVN